ncbi:MAG: methyltransferase domain-containing protein [Desulfomonile tiedjei]|nr:methyltransferase domain-containing protein [Desulfomonile tiedjei]
MPTLDPVIELINKKNPVHGKALDQHIRRCSPEFLAFADSYLAGYMRFLQARNLDREFAVDSYLMVVDDTVREQVWFKRNGRYRYSNFKEVYDKVYSRPDYMMRYMVGLALTQFLWPNHQDIFSFFKAKIRESRGGSYLEIGPGHGLFLLEAVKFGQFDTYTAADVSQTSIDLCRAILDYEFPQHNRGVDFILGDIHHQELGKTYDFVTAGEVLEHIEEPETFMNLVFGLLRPHGQAFVSTCVNAPAIDHIHLFSHTDEIKKVVRGSGFSIRDELELPYAGKTLEEAIKKKLAINYCALLEKV